MSLALFFGVLVLLLVLTVPICVSFAFVTLLPSIVDASFPYTADAAVRSMVSGLNNFPLLAIPLFIIAGVIMAKGQISERLFNVFSYFFGNRTAGLPCAVTITCLFYGAISGSGPATVAAIGSIMIPAMLADGYTKETSAGMVAAAGALGPIIPPSIPMIIYGVTMSLSIPKMFIAGIVPGLVIAGALILVNIFLAFRNPVILENRHKNKFDLKYSLKCLWRALGALGLPVLILGGIYGGIFTPTESAAVAIVYALIVGFFYGELKVKDLPKILVNSAKTSAMVNIIISAASLFSWVVAKSRIGDVIQDWFINLVNGSKNMYLLILVLILLVVGCLMDNIAATLILAPIFIPIGIQLGCNELHIGMLFCIVLVVGFVTPPFGYNLFTAVSLTGLTFKHSCRP